MTTATPSSSGHCLCRNVRYRFGGPRTWTCFCHCEECRRNCAAPIVAYIGVPLDGFRWQVGEQEERSPHLPFQPGSQALLLQPMRNAHSIQAEHYPGEIHLYAATLENPQDFGPTFMCITGKSYHGFIWTIHFIVILGVLLLIGPTHLAANLHLC